MKTLIFLFLLGALPVPASTADSNYYVYGIKIDFPMAEQDPGNALRDFYINLGTAQGVKEGTLLDVYRTISTVDDVNKRVAQKISFKIAKIRVIHAGDDLAVARIVEFKSSKETPLGDIPAVVVGDSVEVARK